MDTEFLPIGTIVKLADVDKKVMITGYFDIEYEGEPVLYDYEGCGYPEGSLLNNNTISFNKGAIEEVIQVGYIDDDFYALNDTIKDENSEIDTLDDDVDYIEEEPK